MAEFSSIVALSLGVETKNCPIWIPLTHGRTICYDCLLWMNPELWSKTFWCSWTLSFLTRGIYWVLINCFVTKNIGSICLKCDSRNTTDDWILVEQRNPLVHLIGDLFLVHFHEFNRIFSKTPSLSCIFRQGDMRWWYCSYTLISKESRCSSIFEEVIKVVCQHFIIYTSLWILSTYL